MLYVSPRRICQWDYISQFSTGIYHIEGRSTNTADFHSRICNIETSIDFGATTEAQSIDKKSKAFLKYGNKHSLLLVRNLHFRFGPIALL